MPVPILNTSNPVNRGHPLARGLVHWWKPLPHNWGGNVLYDIVGGNHATKNGTVTLWNGHNAGGNQPGSSIGNWTNSSNYYSFADVSFSEYTVIAWCRETAFPGTYGFIIGGIAGASQSRLGVLSTTSFGARFFYKRNQSRPNQRDQSFECVGTVCVHSPERHFRFGLLQCHENYRHADVSDGSL